jgi:hypothetical protein
MIHTPMRHTILAALAAAAVLVADFASADTLAGRYPALAAEIEDRLEVLVVPPLSAIERRQKAALTRAKKPMALETNDLAKTLVNRRLTVAALEATFKADPTIAPMLDQLLFNAQLDVTDRTAYLDARAAVLPAGAIQRRVSAFAAAADRIIGLAGDPKRTRAARLGLLSRAFATVTAGEKFLRKGLLTAGVVVDQMEAYAGDRYLFASVGTSSNAMAEYFSADAGMLRLSGGFESDGMRAMLQIRVDAPSVGDHAVVISNDSSYMREAGQLAATGGTVKITTWDPANHLVAGTFEVTFSNGTTTVAVTKGTFSFVNMQTL